MNGHVLTEQKAAVSLPAERSKTTLVKPVNAFAQPRDFLENRFVYLTISPRARGLSMGVNLNPDRRCNFDCVYCEVDRRSPEISGALDLNVLAAELGSNLALLTSGKLREQSPYSHMPSELLRLQHVAISGDG